MWPRGARNFPHCAMRAGRHFEKMILRDRRKKWVRPDLACGGYSSGSGCPFVSGAKNTVTMPMRKIPHIVIAA